MAAKKLFTQIFSYFSKPLRLLYSLIIYEIVNFSFFLRSLLFATSFFLSISEKCSYIRDCSCICHVTHRRRRRKDETLLNCLD